MALISLLVFLLWLAVGFDFIYGVTFTIPILRKKLKPSSSANFPKVSIIFSARNESRTVKAALQSMLAQDYPDFEVIAINDRSTDDTWTVMQSCGSDARLKLLNIQDLPPGWLGKNHALQQGAALASGSWLIFTDADVQFDPQTLKSITAFAEQGKWDSIALLPRMVRSGFLETIYTVCFGLGFFIYFRPWKAPDPRKKNHIGVGAFNMTRQNAYQKIGGHAAFALNVLDDMELARRIKEAGFRQTAVFGREFLSVQWVEGWNGILKSLEKNGFAGMDYRPGFLFIWTLLTALLNTLPFLLAVFAKGDTQLFAFAALASLFLIYFAIQRFHPGTLWVFLFHAPGCLLVAGVLWRSAILTLLQGGIRWRETFYGLDDLRKRK